MWSGPAQLDHHRGQLGGGAIISKDELFSGEADLPAVKSRRRLIGQVSAGIGLGALLASLSLPRSDSEWRFLVALGGFILLVGVLLNEFREEKTPGALPGILYVGGAIAICASGVYWVLDVEQWAIIRAAVMGGAAIMWATTGAVGAREWRNQGLRRRRPPSSGGP